MCFRVLHDGPAGEGSIRAPRMLTTGMEKELLAVKDNSAEARDTFLVGAVKLDTSVCRFVGWHGPSAHAWTSHKSHLYALQRGAQPDACLTPITEMEPYRMEDRSVFPPQ